MNKTEIYSSSFLKSVILKIGEKNPFLNYCIFMFWFRKNFKINRKNIRGNQNAIIRKHAILNGVKFNIIGDNNTIEIEPMAIIEDVTFHIHGNGGHINIAVDSRIANSIFWMEDDGCEIKIGRNSTIGGAHLAATENNSKIIIGDDCMLANDIIIRTGDSHGIYNQLGARINRAENVIIGDHVWLAAQSIILKGTVIGSGSIVGTGSVVKKGNYPANCIVAGNPAKIIKQRINWTRERNAKII